MKITIIENKHYKIFRSKIYNLDFNKHTGEMRRWGKTEDDDPPMSPIGPEILDWEISTVCDKRGSGGNCRFCYKSNTHSGKHISFETFKRVFDKLPRSVCQVAYGIGSIYPGLFDILEYTRAHNIIPNLTINGDATDEEIRKLSRVLGGIAVSYYSDDICFDAVHRLYEESKQKNATLKQINIHALWSNETKDKCFGLLDKIKNDSRLKGLNALVLLSLKKKGRGKCLSSAPYSDFKSIVLQAQKMGISMGMDSCTAPQMFKVVEETDQNDLIQMVEPCESSCFSAYLNVDCFFYPCSFAEGEGEWKNGISFLDCENFVDDVWFHPRTIEWRNKLLQSSQHCSFCPMRFECRSCPIYDITPCKGIYNENNEK